jgi:hypothetical protein
MPRLFASVIFFAASFFSVHRGARFNADNQKSKIGNRKSDLWPPWAL